MSMRKSTDSLAILFPLTLLIFLFFVPNIAILTGGLLGTYITYLVWSVLIVVSLTIILNRRGLGYLNIYSAISFACIPITIYMIMGFYWGFSYKIYPRPSFLLIGIVLFLIKTTGLEVSRSLSMSLVKQRALKILVGILVGLFYGKTYLALTSDLIGFYSKPIAFTPSIMYNTVITLLHLYGGFIPAFTSRVIIDGYWEFFPLTLYTQGIGDIWPSFSVIIYYGLLVYILRSIPSLKGTSKEMFKPITIRRKIVNVLPTTISMMASLALLVAVLNGVLPLIIISGSMRPSYDIGDIVFIRVGEQVGLNDVAAYILADGAVVVHRVIEVRDQGYIVKGDANPDPDPYIVKKEQIIGKVIWAIPRIGWIAIILREGFKHIINPVSLLVIPIGLTLVISLTVISKRYLKHRLIGQRY